MGIQIASRNGQAQRPAPTQNFRDEPGALAIVNALHETIPCHVREDTAALPYTEFIVKFKPHQNHSNPSSGARCPSEAGNTLAQDKRIIVEVNPKRATLVEAGDGYHAQPNVIHDGHPDSVSQWAGTEACP